MGSLVFEPHETLVLPENHQDGTVAHY